MGCLFSIDHKHTSHSLNLNTQQTHTDGIPTRTTSPYTTHNISHNGSSALTYVFADAKSFIDHAIAPPIRSYDLILRLTRSYLINNTSVISKSTDVHTTIIVTSYIHRVPNKLAMCPLTLRTTDITRSNSTSDLALRPNHTPAGISEMGGLQSPTNGSHMVNLRESIDDTMRLSSDHVNGESGYHSDESDESIYEHGRLDLIGYESGDLKGLADQTSSPPIYVITSCFKEHIGSAVIIDAKLISKHTSRFKQILRLTDFLDKQMTGWASID